MRCPSCGSKCRSNNTHCPRCSAPLDPKVAAFGGAARSVREAWGLDGKQETVVVPKRPVSRFLAAALIVLGVAAILVLALHIGHQASKKPAEYPLNGTYFASDSFAALLAPYDANGNGMLSASEAALVTELDCSNMGLVSLAGIEVLANLEVLDASENDLTSFDSTALPKLARLDVAGNNIDSLGFAASRTLAWLDASDNGLTSLDVKGCTALQALVCPGNELARLDLNGCTALVELVCDAGQNVTIPLAAGFVPDPGLRAALAACDLDADGALSERERSGLSSLTVDDPQTQSLYGLAWFSNLSTLVANGTSLQGLDSSELPRSLTSIEAQNCAIKQVALDGMGRLATLDVSSNPLRNLQVSGCQRLTRLDVSNCALSGTLFAGDNPRLEALDASGNPNLSAIDITGADALQLAGAVVCDASCTVILNVELPVEADPNQQPIEGELPPTPQPEDVTQAESAESATA